MSEHSPFNPEEGLALFRQFCAKDLTLQSTFQGWHALAHNIRKTKPCNRKWSILYPSIATAVPHKLGECEEKHRLKHIGSNTIFTTLLCLAPKSKSMMM